MKIIDITEENIKEYEGLLDEECLRSIGREYYRAIAEKDGTSDGFTSALIWEIKSKEVSERNTVSEILLYKAQDEKCGTELLAEYDARIESEGAVHSSFELPELSGSEQSTFENNGYEVKNAESRDVIVTVGELETLPFVGKTPPPYVTSLSEITVRQFKAGLMASVLHERFGLLEDLPFLPKSWYHPEISSCVITDNKINGLLLVHELASGLFRVELLFAMQPDANINLLHMMRYSIREAARLCDKDTGVILRRHNKMSEELIKKLFPDRKGKAVKKGEKDA